MMCVCVCVCATTGLLLAWNDRTQPSESRQRGLCWALALGCPSSTRQGRVCFARSLARSFIQMQTRWRRTSFADRFLTVWGIHWAFGKLSCWSTSSFWVGNTHTPKKNKQTKKNSHVTSMLHARAYVERQQLPFWSGGQEVLCWYCHQGQRTWFVSFLFPLHLTHQGNHYSKLEVKDIRGWPHTQSSCKSEEKKETQKYTSRRRGS